MSCPKHDYQQRIVSRVKLGMGTNQEHESVFENKRVLETIFKNFASGEDSKNLMTLLTVSRKWNCEAKKCLQKINWKYRKFLNIMNSNMLLKYFDTFSAVSDLDHQRFSCFRIDPQAIAIDVSEENYDFESNKTLVENFFQSFGPGIKSLSLEQRSFGDLTINDFQDWLSRMSGSLLELNILIPQQLANLEKFMSLRPMEFNLELNYLCLTLTDWYNCYSDVPAVHHLSFLEMILAKVKVSTPVKIYLLEWRDTGKTIILLEKYNHLKNLKVLDIKDPKDGDIKALTNAELEFLRINDNNSHLSPDILDRSGSCRFVTTQGIYEFLCSQPDILEMLDWSGKYFKFPSQGMKGLKKLRLSWDKNNAHCLLLFPSETEVQAEAAFSDTCIPIVYERLFPNLEELQLTSFAYNVGFSTQFLRQQLPCHTVRRLGIRCLAMDVGFLKLVSDIFPSITAFEIQMDAFFLKDEEDFFSALWGKGTHFADTLEELVLEMNYYDKTKNPSPPYKLDSIFSGVDEDEIDYESDFFEEWDSRKTYVYNPRPRPIRPSILQLKNLRKLSISGAHQFQMADLNCDSFFTDFSAYCLFGRMEKLEWLHIEEGKHSFSKPALDYLKTKLKRSGIEPSIFTSATGQDRVEEFIPWKPIIDHYSPKTKLNFLI